jgi:8-oxo-dGTP pyrophosphatase MutT (NUDIX family)
MNTPYIKKILVNYRKKQDGYRHFSVMIPIIEIDDDPHVLYEVRSESLRSQPGEICFPGGKVELGEHHAETALRETCEELNLDREDIEVIGQIDDIVTPFNMYIHVYVGILDVDLDDIEPNESEVKELFAVPLSYLFDCEVQEFNTESLIQLPSDFPYEKITSGREYNWHTGKYPVLFIDFDDRSIWGITARITASFVRTLKDLSSEISG